MYVTGNVKKSTKTKELTRTILKGEIALIAHEDIDEISAKELIEKKPKAVVNACSSFTGRYSSKGLGMLLNNGINVLDSIGMEPFKTINDGDEVFLNGEYLYSKGKIVAKGNSLTKKDEQLIIDKHHEQALRNKFALNTLEYANLEIEDIFKDIAVPKTATEISGKECIIVARGGTYGEDLGEIYEYIINENPCIIAVDGAADGLLKMGVLPEIIIGDMDSVSDEALKSGSELIVHDYVNSDKRSFAHLRLVNLDLDYVSFSVPGTSEDAALLFAYHKNASKIVGVGLRNGIEEFFEKSRKGMGSTLLTRMKVADIMIDAKGFSYLKETSIDPLIPLMFVFITIAFLIMNNPSYVLWVDCFS